MDDVFLTSLQPRLNEGVFAFVSVPFGQDFPHLTPVASIIESEGITLVLPEDQAMGEGLVVLFLAAWITLSVTSELSAVGLTAAASSALAKAGISCNGIAGAFHDHLFVPIERAGDAMKVLADLESGLRS